MRRQRRYNWFLVGSDNPERQEQWGNIKQGRGGAVTVSMEEIWFLLLSVFIYCMQVGSLILMLQTRQAVAAEQIQNAHNHVGAILTVAETERDMTEVDWNQMFSAAKVPGISEKNFLFLAGTFGS